MYLKRGPVLFIRRKFPSCILHNRYEWAHLHFDQVNKRRNCTGKFYYVFLVGIISYTSSVTKRPSVVGHSYLSYTSTTKNYQLRMGSSSLRNFDDFREWECVNQQLYSILEPLKFLCTLCTETLKANYLPSSDLLGRYLGFTNDTPGSTREWVNGKFAP
jgi:hypothetical protein